MEEAKRAILQMKYARIIKAIADKAGLTLEEAMEVFYNSVTFKMIETGIADLHCRSDFYLADEVVLEWENQKEMTQH